MDTPPRNMINTSPSDVEDSPVSKYINNLSPLKPLKPAYISQTFNSIGCSSPPYVFTSAHGNCLKESRFVQSHDDLVETSEPRLSYEHVDRFCSSEEALADSFHANNNSTQLHDNAHQGISVGDASIIDLSGDDDTEFSFGQPQGSDDNYFGCPVDYPPLLGDDEANSLLPLPGEAASDVANVPKGCETNSVEGEQPHLQGMCQMEPRSEGQEDDWDNVIPDATTLLSFNHSQMEDSGQVVDYMSVVTQYLVNDGRGVIDSAFSHFEETGGCKHCNCKKSKCLKLYCDCFAAGVYCSAPCSCENCFNQPLYKERVIQTRKQIEIRNPLAFAPEVTRSSDSADEIGDDPNKTPAPARHKRGCSCKKSSCNKKYCDCYKSGVGCSTTCRCEGCKNAYGRKDGSPL